MVLSGPTTIHGLEARNEETTSGTSSEYSPAVTGSLAMSAYAIDAGSASAATVTPATASVRSRPMLYPRI
jgi:hypothetical protein